MREGAARLRADLCAGDDANRQRHGATQAGADPQTTIGHVRRVPAPLTIASTKCDVAVAMNRKPERTRKQRHMDHTAADPEEARHEAHGHAVQGSARERDVIAVDHTATVDEPPVRRPWPGGRGRCSASPYEEPDGKRAEKQPINASNTRRGTMPTASAPRIAPGSAASAKHGSCDSRRGLAVRTRPCPTPRSRTPPRDWSR